MKNILATMFIFYLIVNYFGEPFYGWMFPQGNMEQSSFSPVYFGLMALSGIIIACTVLILDGIKEVKSDLKQLRAGRDDLEKSIKQQDEKED